MDGTRFDTLIKRLATTPLTRAQTLRGLAASAAALAGVTLLADSGAAADGGGRRRRRRRVCDCENANPNTCTNRRLKRRAARRLLRSNACAYKGGCTGVSGCAVVGCSPPNNTRGTCPAGQICNERSICVAAGVGCSPPNNTQGSCPAGQVCNTFSICVPAVGCLNTANPQCGANQICCPSETASAGQCRGTLQAC
jgi:hypothetical protein